LELRINFLIADDLSYENTELLRTIYIYIWTNVVYSVSMLKKPGSWISAHMIS